MSHGRARRRRFPTGRYRLPLFATALIMLWGGVLGMAAVAAAAAGPAVAAAAFASASAASALAAGAGGGPTGTLPAAFATGQAGFAIAMESVIAVPHAGVVRVDEIVEGANIGKRPISDLTLPLPAQATLVQGVQGQEPARLRAVGTRLSLGTVKPGATVRVSFAYAVPEEQGAVWLPVGYPTVYLFVLVPHGRWRLQAPGFARHGAPQALGPITLDAYVTETPTPGASLPLRFVPVPLLPWPAAAGGGAALMALGVAAALAVRRRRRASLVSPASNQGEVLYDG